jgi:His-Xaa-Ser system protein HxsD
LGNLILSSKTVKTNFIKILINSTIYEKEAILSTNYALSGLCSTLVELGSDGYFDVTLESLADNEEGVDLERIKQCFLNELTDQQLRLDLEKKFGRIRELIVRQAFSPLENLEKEVEKLVDRA